MPATAGQIGERFRIGRPQVRLVPVIAANLVVLGDVQLAFVKREAVRLIQPAEDIYRPRCLPGVFRIGKRDHLALSRFADQQDASRAEDHHARAVHVFGKN